MKNSLIVTTPTDREIAMTRVFDAPRNLVYEAWTRPELLKRWLGVQNGWTLDVCEVDQTVGGISRYVWRNPNGVEMGMRQTCLEVVPGERIVCTESFDDPWYEGEAVATTTFVERDGRTTATNTVRYASKEVRDAVLKTPMEKGVAVSYDRLEELLASKVA